MTGFRFYYGAASGSSRKALRQLEEPNVMINYATENNKPWKGIDNLFIDSGGYSFMLGKGEYETTDKEYLEFIEKHQPQLFALRDYPCEPDVLEKNNTTVEEHQRKTVERHSNLLDLLQNYEIEGQPVSVIQGWKLEDYLTHLEMLREADCLTDYIAIGSVCRRNQDHEIRQIINKIHAEIGDRKLHAFGVKTNVLRFPEIKKKLDSADSNAYDMSSRYSENTVTGEGCNGFRNVAYHYLKFKKEINQKLNENPQNVQQTLEVKA